MYTLCYLLILYTNTHSHTVLIRDVVMKKLGINTTQPISSSLSPTTAATPANLTGNTSTSEVPSITTTEAPTTTAKELPDNNTMGIPTVIEIAPSAEEVRALTETAPSTTDTAEADPNMSQSSVHDSSVTETPSVQIEDEQREVKEGAKEGEGAITSQKEGGEEVIPERSERQLDTEEGGSTVVEQPERKEKMEESMATAEGSGPTQERGEAAKLTEKPPGSTGESD